MNLTPKQARQLGLIAPEPPRAPRAPTTTRRVSPSKEISLDEYKSLQSQPKPPSQNKRQSIHRIGSLAWAESLGWQLTTTPAGVSAWRVRGGTVERTATLPAGDGDDLGRHYGPAVRAVERGEYTTEIER